LKGHGCSGRLEIHLSLRCYVDGWIPRGIEALTIRGLVMSHQRWAVVFRALLMVSSMISGMLLLIDRVNAGYLYVVLEVGDIVAYDVSLSTAAEIEASKRTVMQGYGAGPYGMVLDRRGNLFVANFFLDNISKFGPSGQFITSFTGNLSGPLGLAMDDSGDLYVSSFHTSTVTRFSSEGVVKSRITSNIINPVGLTFDAAGNLYVANSNGGAITKFDSNGVFVGSLVAFTPEGIYISPSGTIFATLRDRDRVRKMDASGNFVKVFGLDDLKTPSSIVADDSGNLYVTNRGKTKIHKYDQEGNLLLSWDTPYYTYGALFDNRSYPVPEPTSFFAFATLTTFAVGCYRKRSRILSQRK
jgi:streptogramin lyase